MKHFVFVVKEEKVSRTYGGADVTVSVYQIKRNRPVWLTSVKWCTRGYKGAETEVQNALAREKKLPRTFAETYYKRDNGLFSIEGL